MESNMLLMITLAIVAMLILYKPQSKIEGFESGPGSIWALAPACNVNAGQICDIGSRCIKSNGVPTTNAEDGKCIKCANSANLIDTNTTAGSGFCIMPNPLTCPECSSPEVGTLKIKN